MEFVSDISDKQDHNLDPMLKIYENTCFVEKCGNYEIRRLRNDDYGLFENRIFHCHNKEKEILIEIAGIFSEIDELTPSNPNQGEQKHAE